MLLGREKLRWRLGRKQGGRPLDASGCAVVGWGELLPFWRWLLVHENKKPHTGTRSRRGKNVLGTLRFLRSCVRSSGWAMSNHSDMQISRSIKLEIFAGQLQAAEDWLGDEFYGGEI